MRLLAAGLLTRDAVDFFEVFTWPVLVILGGYFGHKLLDRLPVGKRRALGVIADVGNDENNVGDGERSRPSI